MLVLRSGLILFAFISLGACGNPEVSNSGLYRTFFSDHRTSILKDYNIPSGDQLSYWGTDKNTLFYKTLDGDGERKAPYWTNGDFNRDGYTDWAYILFSTNDDARLFVFISGSSKHYQIVDLGTATNTMGVSTDKLQCGKNVFDLIRFFEFEGHGSMVAWDSSIQALKMYTVIPEAGLCSVIQKQDQNTES